VVVDPTKAGDSRPPTSPGGVKKRVSREIAGRDGRQSKSKPDSQTFKGRQIKKFKNYIKK
jgi:hypothetical protein